MKILQVHNYYQLSGGEDTVVANEKALLEENGHEVIPFYKHNEEINDYSFFRKMGLLYSTTWSQKTYDEAMELIRSTRPNVCHVHNFLPLISPSIYKACKDSKVPVVQTLHNYRLICTNGLFLREGKVCEECLGKSAYHSVPKKCYRHSYTQTYAVARMIEKNKADRTWTKHVDAYFCFTEFAKNKFIESGLPEEKLIVKPNFVKAPSTEVTEGNIEPYLIYVGRLEENKGIQLFVEISKELDIPLKIVGEGPMEAQLSDLPKVELLGKRPHDEVLTLIQQAKALLFPSLCYEGMPMTILEAFAHKTPVVASNLGAMQTIISHQENGLLFEANSADELLSSIQLLMKNEEMSRKIAETAFADFEKLYSRERNYERLMDCYNTVINKK